MNALHLIVRQAAGAAGLVLGIALIAGWQARAAQEPPAGGKPRPDLAASGRASGPRNVIEGTDENDRLNGTDADDWVFGRKGADFITGGKGRDVIDAGDGDDTVDGDADNDIIDGGAGSDTIRGGDGDDTIEANDDDDLVDGGGGNDNADGGDGSDFLRGGPGDDVLAGGDGDDSLSGGAGNDRLSGNDGVDSILGGAGNDQIAAGDQDDLALGEAGDDVIDGGGGDDTVKGGAGNDTLTGSWGADTLDGGPDQDTVFGGDGRDVVNGGGGADLLLGGSGVDVVNGGDGDDIIIIRAGDVPRGETELTDGGAGTDLLTLNGFTPRDAATGREFADPITSGTYRVMNVERVQHTHVVPHLGLDPARSTSLLLVNPSSTEPATGRVVFYGGDGAPVATRADALKNGTFTVPPLGAVVVDVFAAKTASVASAQVFSNVPLAVAAQTQSPTIGTFGARESVFVDAAMVPIAEEPAAGTGVLIANSALRSRVRLTVLNSTGVELECCSTVLDLQPYAQRLVWIRDLFPRLSDFQGTVLVDTGTDRPQEGGPLAVVALQRRGTAMSASPAVRVGPGLVTGPVLLTSIGTGGDAPSTITVFNPSTSSRARGVVGFFDAQGRPWSVAVNRQPAAATAAFDLPPRASAVFVLAGAGAAQTGFARVETTEGTVGSAAKTGAMVAEASSATAASAFVAAVVRDRAGNTTTEVALTSTGSAAVVQLSLHDATGAQVAGGTTQVRVPAAGQIVRSFDDLFPNVKFAAIQGALMATSDQRVWASIIRSGNGSRATLPVMPTR